MQFDLITIFPEFFGGFLGHGIVRKAREAGLVDVRVTDLREFTKDKHRTVDDRPFGGGEGMVLKPEPLFAAVESLLGRDMGDAASEKPLEPKTAVVLTSASGRLFTQGTARRYAGLERLIVICGRYEGVDERVAQHLATEEVSIGDFVLSGGELAAGVIVDAVTRLVPGALGNEASAVNESFSIVDGEGLRFGDGAVGERPGGGSEVGSRFGSGGGRSGNVGGGGCVLDFPHYTRPAEFRGWSVPEVLIGGNHADVAKWRREAALEKTRRMRPELLLK